MSKTRAAGCSVIQGIGNGPFVKAPEGLNFAFSTRSLRDVADKGVAHYVSKEKLAPSLNIVWQGFSLSQQIFNLNLF